MLTGKDNSQLRVFIIESATRCAMILHDLMIVFW